MKTNIILLIAIAAITYGLTLYFGQSKTSHAVTTAPVRDGIQKPLNAQPVPSFTITDINDKEHSINDFKGKTVILNFWASWCAPCVKEFPLLINAIHNNDEVILIALSSDLDEESIIKFIDKMTKTQNLDFDHPNILIAHDNNQAITASLFGTFKLPETILIAPDQTMRHKFIGANWTAEDLQNWIDKLAPAQ